MKSFLLILFISVLLLTCNSSNKYEFEDQFMECVYAESGDGGETIKENLRNFENAFVEKGIFESTQGDAYISFLEKIVENKGLSFVKIDFSDFPEPWGLACNKEEIYNDTAGVNASGFGKFFRLINGVAERGEISIVNISEEMLEEFSASDFEHDFYKNCFFMVMNFSISPMGIDVTLPPISEEGIDLKKLDPKDVLHVKVGSNNEIEINTSKTIEASEVKSTCKAFLLDTLHFSTIKIDGFGEQHSSNKKIISLKNTKETSYEVYLEVYNEIKSAYNEIWDEKSKELFNKGYEELSREQQKVIQKIYPMVISEAEPNDN